MIEEIEEFLQYEFPEEFIEVNIISDIKTKYLINVKYKCTILYEYDFNSTKDYNFDKIKKEVEKELKNFKNENIEEMYQNLTEKEKNILNLVAQAILIGKDERKNKKQ